MACTVFKDINNIWYWQGFKQLKTSLRSCAIHNLSLLKYILVVPYWCRQCVISLSIPIYLFIHVCIFFTLKASVKCIISGLVTMDQQVVNPPRLGEVMTISSFKSSRKIYNLRAILFVTKGQQFFYELNKRYFREPWTKYYIKLSHIFGTHYVCSSRAKHLSL